MQIKNPRANCGGDHVPILRSINTKLRKLKKLSAKEARLHNPK